MSFISDSGIASTRGSVAYRRQRRVIIADDAREIIAQSAVFSECSGEDASCDSLASLLPYS